MSDQDDSWWFTAVNHRYDVQNILALSLRTTHKLQIRFVSPHYNWLQSEQALTQRKRSYSETKTIKKPQVPGQKLTRAKPESRNCWKRLKGVMHHASADKSVSSLVFVRPWPRMSMATTRTFSFIFPAINAKESLPKHPGWCITMKLQKNKITW